MVSGISYRFKEDRNFHKEENVVVRLSDTSWNP